MIEVSSESERFERLVGELCRLPAETSWVEFKHNNSDPHMIGELVAALSNTATLEGKEKAWIVWGVEDGSHEIVGTDFVPAKEKKGNQELESWLVQLLSPRLNICFHTTVIEGKPVVLLEVPGAQGQPTAFSGKELIRIGSTRRALREVPERERALWRCFDEIAFERQVALTDQSSEEVLRQLDYASFFELLDMPLPTAQDGILEALRQEDFIRPNDAGHWDVTNLGAILIARDLKRFWTMSRKAVRLIIYKGRARLETEREQEGQKGYALGFEGLMDFLKARLPRNEVIGEAFRKDVPMYPDLALRELIANALIHQDFTITGMGPMVEVFEDRIEVTNPGAPLGDINRLLDQPPRSRNEALAACMRRIGLCEERGGGVDKVVFETELYQLPPPRWEVSGQAFRAVLFAHKELREMDREARVYACYLHASLRFVMRETLTNASLRQRFGIEEHNKAQASRYIREALDARMIKPYDPQQGRKDARYLPFWA